MTLYRPCPEVPNPRAYRTTTGLAGSAALSYASDAPGIHFSWTYEAEGCHRCQRSVTSPQLHRANDKRNRYGRLFGREFLRSPPAHNKPIWGDTPGREASGLAIMCWLVVGIFFWLGRGHHGRGAASRPVSGAGLADWAMAARFIRLVRGKAEPRPAAATLPRVPGRPGGTPRRG
jgi:hypothetical protein